MIVDDGGDLKYMGAKSSASDADGGSGRPVVSLAGDPSAIGIAARML
jgi:hypothetical protein